jgi:hypothetical protein
MLLEADRPLRRLQADAVRLAKGERERLAEDGHGGRFGSIARSVNIQVDKLVRDAKAAKKDLDQLLGPAPEGSLGAMDLLGGTPLPARPGIQVAPALAPPSAPSAPPPSQFRFSDQPAPKPVTAAPQLDLPPPKAPARPAMGAPPPAPPRPPVPVSGGGGAAPPPRPPASVRAPSAPPRKGIDDDILSQPDESGPTTIAPMHSTNTEETYFREVFEQFVELKRKCGEPTTGLTYAKFGEKLRKNRDELMAKTGCTQVRFTVYVKDGKAALKATPVKEA